MFIRHIMFYIFVASNFSKKYFVDDVVNIKVNAMD
jgi:hypothetical protein